MAEMREVTSERLRFRPFREDDDAAFAAIFAKPAVMRYMIGGPKTAEEAAGSVRRKMDHWAEHGFGLWCLELLESGDIVGQCGLAWNVQFDGIEVAYLLDEPYWGRGLSTEAVSRSLQFGRQVLGVETIFAIIQPDNLASRKVIERNGMVHAKDVTIRDIPHCYYLTQWVQAQTEV